MKSEINDVDETIEVTAVARQQKRRRFKSFHSNRRWRKRNIFFRPKAMSWTFFSFHRFACFFGASGFGFLHLLLTEVYFLWQCYLSRFSPVYLCQLSQCCRRSLRTAQRKTKQKKNRRRSDRGYFFLLSTRIQCVFNTLLNKPACLHRSDSFVRCFRQIDTFLLPSTCCRRSCNLIPDVVVTYLLEIEWYSTFLRENEFHVKNFQRNDNIWGNELLFFTSRPLIGYLNSSLHRKVDTSWTRTGMKTRNSVFFSHFHRQSNEWD